jgi:MFS family permease
VPTSDTESAPSTGVAMRMARVVEYKSAFIIEPRVGQQAEKHGRKPLLLVGFAALPVRAVLFALTDNPLVLVIIQLLDGITGAVLGVMTALVIADVTRGTGRFNLAQGVFGTLMGVGASFSPILSGLIVHHFGYSTGFVSLAAEALIAFVILAAFLPETKAEPAALNPQAVSGTV